MSGLEATCGHTRHSPLRWAMLALSVAFVLLLVVQGFLSIAAPAEWLRIVAAPNLDDPRHVVGYYSFLPRLAVGLLVGGTLGLGGAVFQTVLRNPLAEPGLLGVASGAQIALAFTLVFAPAYGLRATKSSRSSVPEWHSAFRCLSPLADDFHRQLWCWPA